MFLNQFSSIVNEQLGFDLNSQVKILKTFSFILILWFSNAFLVKLALIKVTDPKSKYKARKIFGYISSVLGVIIIGRIWFEGFTSIATYLGLVSAGLTIALKDLINDLAAWLFIIGKQPFKLGDRIEIGENKGDVIDIDSLQFTLMEVGAGRIDAEQSTGRMIHIPNAQVFNTPLANFTKGFEYIWNEIPILVTFESDRKKVKSILNGVLDKHVKDVVARAKRRIDQASQRFLINTSKLSPRVYTDVKDSGVLYTLRYLCHPHQKRDTVEKIIEDVLEEFDKHKDIDFAYNTTRVFRNNEEGKHLD